MKIKNLIKEKKCSYSVEYYDKRVKCFMTLTIGLPEELCAVCYYDFANQIENKFYNCIMVPNGIQLHVVGTAVCNNKDTFSIERGKQISRIKACQKAYDTFARIFKDIEKRLSVTRLRASEIGEFFKFMANREYNYIGTL